MPQGATPPCGRPGQARPGALLCPLLVRGHDRLDGLAIEVHAYGARSRERHAVRPATGIAS